MEARAYRLLQKVASRFENKNRCAADVKEADTTEEVAKRVPLSDGVPVQPTDAPQGDGKLSDKKPAKSRPQVIKEKNVQPKAKACNVTPAVSTEKIGKLVTSAKEGVVETAKSHPKEKRVRLRVGDCDVIAESQQAVTAEKAKASKPSSSVPERAKSAKRARLANIEKSKAPEAGKTKRARK